MVTVCTCRTRRAAVAAVAAAVSNVQTKQWRGWEIAGPAGVAWRCVGQPGAGDDGASWTELCRLVAGAPVALDDGMSESKRALLAGAAVSSVACVQKSVLNLVTEWEGEHAHELWRRGEQERYRGLVRLIVRAWREVADGRRAGGGSGLPVAEAEIRSVAWAAAVPERAVVDGLAVPFEIAEQVAVPVGGEGGVAVQARPVQVATPLETRYVATCTQRTVSEEARLAVTAVSAVRPGTQARALLLYARLVHGGVARAVRRGDAHAVSEWLHQFDWGDLRDMARRGGLAQTGDRQALVRRLRGSYCAAILERGVAERRRLAAAAQAELTANPGVVDRGRVTHYDVAELRSGGARSGRPVARGHGAGAGASAGATADEADATGAGGAAVDGEEVMDCCSGDDVAPVTVTEVLSVVGRVAVTVTEVRDVVQGQARRPRALVGLARSTAWRRRHRRTAAAQVTRIGSSRRGRVGRKFNRWMMDYMRATMEAMERVWHWTWGVVQRGWQVLGGARRVRPRVGGEERLHGRPPE